MSKQITIEYIGVGIKRQLPPTTRCLTESGICTIADLAIGDLAAVEDTSSSTDDDHGPDANGDAARDGHVWWCAERVA
jgi:hypothetical protein